MKFQEFLESCQANKLITAEKCGRLQDEMKVFEPGGEETHALQVITRLCKGLIKGMYLDKSGKRDFHLEMDNLEKITQLVNKHAESLGVDATKDIRQEIFKQLDVISTQSELLKVKDPVLSALRGLNNVHIGQDAKGEDYIRFNPNGHVNSLAGGAKKKDGGLNLG